MITRKEMCCPCGCGFDAIDHELKYILERCDYELDNIAVSSGNRCEKYNKTLKNASPTSLHIYGKAADIVSETKTPEELYKYFSYSYPGRLELILYNTFVHVGVQDFAERLDFRG